jgi:ABC-type methionine transport system permease subunit
MSYATGLRLLAALCFATIIGAPLGLFLLWQARKKEKEKEKLVEAATS